MDKNRLKQDFDTLCNEYAKLFEEKHEIDFDYWIGGQVGDLASFNEYYAFNIHEIKEDIDNDYPAGLILQWVADNTENVDYGTNINLKSYAMGLRYDELRRRRDNQESKIEIDWKEKFKDFMVEHNIDFEKLMKNSRKKP
jgi:hypothetical protein